MRKLTQMLQNSSKSRFSMPRTAVLATLGLLLSGVMASVSAQDVEPDELGFVIGTPDVLEPAEGSRSVLIYGDPRSPACTSCASPLHQAPVAARIITAQLVTSL